jgi:Acetyltransferase (GNAT) domain
MPDLPFPLRAHQVVYPVETHIERRDGFWCVQTPSNPTFFWGNFLHFDAPPTHGDLARWQALFDLHVRATQPQSRHVAFSWHGAEHGASAEFAQSGYAALDSVVMVAERLAPARAPAVDARIRHLAGDADWDALVEFHVRTRVLEHSEEGYRAYAQRKAAYWRKYAEAGSGTWVAAFVGDELAAALGLYAEARGRSSDGKLARYQDVVTDPRWRKCGLCSALLVRAATELERLEVSRHVIIADEHDVARPVYAARGFQVVGYLRGLQRALAETAP